VKSTSDIIKQELRYVLDISQTKIDRLAQASDVQIGKSDEMVMMRVVFVGSV
jgi:uncharacterized protein YehS (DUF1456 family)